MPDIRIYTSRGCGWAVRNYAALREKRVDFTAIPAVDAAGNKLVEFLAATPYGKTPVLLDGTTAVFESSLINDYIDDRFPEAPLMPDDVTGRAEARKWMHYCETRLLPQLTAIARAEGAAAREGALGGLQENMEWFEAAVLTTRFEGPYFFGERFSLLEIVFHTFFSTLDAVHGWAGESPRILQPLLLDWREAIAERESIRYAEDFRRNLGF